MSEVVCCQLCLSANGWWLVQTYEGGLGGEPGNEAHGGYTFCGLAALVLINQAQQLDLPRLIHWAVHMQVCASGFPPTALRNPHADVPPLQMPCWTVWAHVQYSTTLRCPNVGSWVSGLGMTRPCL